MKNREMRAALRRRAALFDTLEQRLLLCSTDVPMVDANGNPLGTYPAMIIDGPNSQVSAPASSPLASSPVAAPAASLSVPVFNSKPGAKARLFLDFNGAIAQSWGGSNVTATPAFDTDSDPTTFSDSELAAITEICARVAEKYSPFDINVTTVDPGSYHFFATTRIVIGGTGAWTNGTYGGISYVGGFSGSVSDTGWVFSTNLSNVPKYVAEATAHEAGHTFDLQHQSQYDAAGTKLAEYFPGDSLRAPIMGNSYYAQRGLWWSGSPSTSATATQDDVAVIAGPENRFGYRADEAGATTATAATLTVTGNSYSAAGVITTISDVDAYRFILSAAGNVAFNLGVAPLGAMLDGTLELLDSQGSAVKVADTASLSETLSMDLLPGTYYVAAASHGATGDIGQYTINGTFTAAPVPTAPAGLVATVVSPTAVHLIWADQSSNEVGFHIERSTDGVNWTVIGTTEANVTAFDDAGLSPATTYQYRVSAFTDLTQAGYSNSLPVMTWGGGDGLHADYFDNIDFTGDTIAQTDATVDFNWQIGAPLTGISPGTFSARWTGQVQPQETGVYTFSTTADDGVRLWVDGQLVIDRWSDVTLRGDANGDGVVDGTDLAAVIKNMGKPGTLAQGDFNGDGVVNFVDFQIMELGYGNSISPVTDRASVALVAGVKYDIKLEYYQQSGPASVKLEWTTPAALQQVIPQSEMFAALPPTPPAGAAVPASAIVSSGGTLVPTTKAKAEPKKVAKPLFSLVAVVKPKVKPLRKGSGNH